MNQTKPLLDAVKRELKHQGKTYRDVAAVLGLSETSVKRLFSEQSFNLKKLDRLCESLGIEFSDLVRSMEQHAQRVSQLSLEQEKELVSDIKLLLMAHFLISGWTFQEIVATYDVGELEGVRLLARLDRMKFIELFPGNRVKLTVASDFSWIEGGPIEQFFRAQVQTEFLESQFSSPGAYRAFRSGMLSRRGNAAMIHRLDRLAREFLDMCADDESLPIDDRFGTSLLIAFRPWGVSVFESLRKVQGKVF